METGTRITSAESDYLIQEKLGEGGMSHVFKAADFKTKKPVAIKFLKHKLTSSSIEDVIRFKREVDIVSKLNHSHVIRLYGTGEYRNTPYLVTELLEGANLGALFSAGERFEIQDAVEMVRQVAEALSYVHGMGILHRDLKPGNIFVSRRDNGFDVKLLDFGVAFVMELGKIKDEAGVVGTFGYMSPEATGIMNRVVDERSDLYSLGVIFYQLLTHRPPFPARDVNKLLHQQVAVMPPRPGEINPGVSPRLDEIVMKLLHKEPDSRYQSARGLLNDLDQFLRGETEFVPGEKDLNVKINYQMRFMGRAKELAAIKKLYHDSEGGKGSVCLVGGEAGIGKNRLVEEVRGYVYEQGGLFIEGRCLNQETKMPYEPFSNAINEYIRKIERLDPGSRENEIHRMRKLLGDLSDVINRLNPRMRGLLGSGKELVSLDPERENQRFLMVASRFFCHLAEKGQTAVLCLNDLQWADEASLLLLENILMRVHESNLLVLGTYRDNEIQPDHGLSRIRFEAAHRHYALSEFKLGAFDSDSVGQMLAGMLKTDAVSVKTLAQCVFERSGGNPLFAITVIRELIEEKAIFWRDGRWQQDWEKISRIPVAANMLDLILRRTVDLPADLKAVLCAASVIGIEFEIRRIAALVPLSPDAIVKRIDEAISLQFLKSGHAKGKVMFVHDKIRDAFYQQLEPAKKRLYHIQMARFIESMNPNYKGTLVFALAHHFVQGGDLDKALQYALPAARRAQRDYANDEAVKYYLLGIDLLERKGKHKKEEWVRAKEGLAEVYMVTGRSAEAVSIFEQLIPMNLSTLDQVRLNREIATAYFRKGNFKDCESNVVKSLTLLGHHIPRTAVGFAAAIAAETVWRALIGVFPAVNFPGKFADGKFEYAESVGCYRTLCWMYALTDSRKFAYAVLKLLNFTRARAGLQSPEFILGTRLYGSLCMYRAEFKKAARYFDEALTLGNQGEDPWDMAQTLQLLGHNECWRGDYPRSIDAFHKSAEICQRIGNLWQAGQAASGLGHAYYCRGDYAMSVDFYLQYLSLSRRIKDEWGESASEAFLCACYAERGDYLKAEESGRKALAMSEAKEIWFIHTFTLIQLAQLEVEKGGYDAAVGYLEKARQRIETNQFILEYTVGIYASLAEAYLEKVRIESDSWTPDQRKKTLKKISALCGTALRKAKHWPNHHGPALRAAARCLAAQKRHRKARVFFQRALEHDTRLGRRYERAKTHYAFGCFLKAWGNRDSEARSEWEQAMVLFREVGAKAGLNRCLALLGHKEIIQEIPEETPRERLIKERRVTAVFNTSMYLSSILDFDELLGKILDCAVELVGAQRAILLLYPEQDEAEKKLEVAVLKNMAKDGMESPAFGLCRSIVSRVERTRKPLIIQNAQAEEEFRHEESVIQYGVKSVLCAPILAKGESLGIIYLENPLVSGLFNQEDLGVLELIGSQAAVSIQNARLYRKAITDGLTGLYNRVFFENYLIHGVALAQRYSKKACVIFLDIDQFKPINDEYGHAAGDEVLKKIAGLLRERIRKADVAARYGGDEFVVLLPEAGPEDARNVAEELRRMAMKLEIPWDKDGQEQRLKVTLSLGVASWIEGQTSSELVAHADEALYRAKSLGRNCVAVYDPAASSQRPGP